MATNEPIETARVKFGNVLRFHREQRSHTTRRVADMCGVSREAIENFEAGHVVPDGKTWDKYKGIVNKQLAAYGELRGRALKEAEAERALLINSMEHRKMATANGANGHTTKPPSPPLAHKPFAEIKMPPMAGAISTPTPDARTVNPGQAVTYHAAPQPRIVKYSPTEGTAGDQLGDHRGYARDGRRLSPDRPPNSMAKEAVNERIAWARLQFRSRPRMPVNGADGLLVLLRKRFGVGLDTVTCQRIKAEVMAELQQLPPAHPAGVSTAAPPEPPPIIPPTQRQAIPIPVVATDPAENISAAVSLVLDAIPNLRSFTIDVDDNGEAQVNYTMREVKVIETGGSLKVKR